jgi:hypothetical protein
MKESLVFKMENHEAFTLKHHTQLLNLKTDCLVENSSGIVPTPRDGHSTTTYNNSLVVFGGDRNKFSFNDLFIYNLEQEYEQS